MSLAEISGVGLGYQPYLHQDTLRHLSQIDFVEVTPEKWINLESVVLNSQAEELAKNIQISFHGVDLSLLSPEPLDQQFLSQVCKLSDRFSVPWVSEHLAYQRTRDIDAELYFPPIFSEKSLDLSITRMGEVCEVLNRPFHVENVAVLGNVPGSEWSESEFLTRLFQGSSSRWVFNVDSFITTCVVAGVDPSDELQSYPLDAVESVTFVPPRSMNPILARRFGADIERIGWKICDAVVRNSPARSILIQRRYLNDFVSCFELELGYARAILTKAGRYKRNGKSSYVSL